MSNKIRKNSPKIISAAFTLVLISAATSGHSSQWDSQEILSRTVAILEIPPIDSSITPTPPPVLAPANTSQHLPDIYFDLGNVVVDTRDWSRVDYVPNMQSYLADLETQGYRKRLLINFVDQLTVDETTEVYSTCADKFAGLVRFLDSKWAGSTPFDWEEFDMVILPPKNQQRKPRPYMFINALSSSCPRKILFQGEDLEEMMMANFLGISHWQVSLEQGISLLEIEEIPSFVEESFRFSYPTACQIPLPKQCALDSDQIQIISHEVRGRLSDTSQLRHFH